MILKKYLNTLSIIAMAIFFGSSLMSCERNELSELVGDEMEPAEPLELVTYANTAKAILDSSCVECHNPSNTNGGVQLHTYENAFSVADSGRMIIRMTSSSNPMPPSGNLPDAIIQRLRDWIDDGLLEN